MFRLARREFLAAGLSFPRFAAAAERPRAAFLNFDTVQHVIEACRLVLPHDLAGLQSDRLRRAWPEWVRRHDSEVRSRLVRGEEDSLVNFVLYGVSFTSQGRGENIDARIKDFLRAVQHPGNNERLLWLKEMLAGSRQTRPEDYVRENISRYLAEQRGYRAVLDSAPVNDPVAAQLYRDRGLSIDTNFRPNWAIEKALGELKRSGVLTSVRRAAIVGPGLDFTDKDHGFDYYPLQTLQPFGLADSLIRLGLATLPDLRIGVFDISSLTLAHLSRAVGRAQAGQSYTVQLVLDEGRAWDREALAFWRRFGDRVGTAGESAPLPPQVRNVERKAVRIRPAVVRSLEPLALNIVTQNLGLAGDQRYDLVVGTNVFVYYDSFERALSMVNIEAMLSSRGILLANSPLPECSGGSLHSIGRVEVKYSADAGDDDRIQIYSNARFGRPLGPE